LAGIKDVAKLAGVNISTVSRYLSGQLKVKQETEKRIISAIAELDYRPNVLAKALKTKVTNTIGIIIPTIRNPLFADIVAGINFELSQINYASMLFSTENEPDKEYEGLVVLSERQVDGIIVVGSLSMGGYDKWIKYQDSTVPLVFVNRFWEKSRVSKVVTDFISGSEQAVRYLFSRGYKNIAMIIGSWRDEESLIKLKGFKQGIKNVGFEYRDNLVVEGCFNYEDSFKAVTRLFKFKPDAILACSDLMAVAAMQAAMKCGFKIPDELAIVGYGNSQISRFTVPSLTTISQHAFTSGQEATKLLVKLFDNPKNFQVKEISTELIKRNST
jgi:LacI family transcriptional regulator